MKSKRLFARSVARVLADMGDPQITNRARRDAGETAFFTRALEHVLATIYETQYPEHMARALLPINTQVPSGAESFVWRSFDYAGMAKIITNYADDLPLVDIMAGETAQAIKSLADAYQYSIQDIRASQMTDGMGLDVRRGVAAKRAMENALEQIAAFGNTGSGLPGFINNPNATTYNAGSDGIVGKWLDPTTTSLSILNDMNKFASLMAINSKNVFSPDTMVMPLSLYEIVSNRVMSEYDSTTILQMFLNNQTRIKNVAVWTMLDKGNAALTGPRIICYKRSSECLELVVPQDFEQLPPQARNLAFVVPCHMRIGGVTVFYPMSVAYFDGLEIP